MVTSFEHRFKFIALLINRGKKHKLTDYQNWCLCHQLTLMGGLSAKW